MCTNGLSLVAATVLVMLPVTGRAEESWRWRDSSGQLHYTNERRRAPESAEAVETQIRIVPRREEAEVTTVKRLPRHAPPRGRYYARTAGFAPPGPCDGSAYSWIVFNNSHELADQVKQASLLDALGIPWRRGACR